MEADWNLVADRKPQGYLELNDGRQALYAPVESVVVDENDTVVITTKWQAARELGELGIPTGDGKFKVVPENTPIAFPNLIVPFVFEQTPDKGERVRFGLNILYLEPVEKIQASDVEGLVL